MRFRSLLWPLWLSPAMAGRGVVKDDSCENNATSRGCWGAYSIDTDYYAVAPETNVTREYWLVAENKVLAPDGVDRPMMVWNGSFPGPLIEANWGDNVIVHVTNNLKDNGTTVHWHGLRQLRNNEYDGVPGATQCPIPPGETMTYRWRATQYGTTWYHSHFSLQFSEGLYGPLVIHGPATADYDVDLGPVFIQDWYHQTAFTTWAQAEHQALGVTVSSDTGLINGKNMWQGVQGQYEVFKFEQGNKYRLRIIGVQTDSWMRFAIDNHDLTVIATDLVPIRPYTTNSLNVAPGQRYDVVVEANAGVGNYWMRSIYQTQCSNVGNANPDAIRAIVRYEGALPIQPLSLQTPTLPQSCEDEDAQNIIPYMARHVGHSQDSTQISVQFWNGTEKKSFFQWSVGTVPLVVNWSDPTNMQLQRNQFTFPDSANVHGLGIDDEWAYYVLQDGTSIGLSHPFHLHGHDFFILGTGNGTFDNATATLNLYNPPRRDTATMPGGGWLAIAFKADNPGTWLFHCHIAWHASQSLAMQVVERESEINSIWTSEVDNYDQMCSKWSNYYHTAAWKQDDSGV